MYFSSGWHMWAQIYRNLLRVAGIGDHLHCGEEGDCSLTNRGCYLIMYLLTKKRKSYEYREKE